MKYICDDDLLYLKSKYHDSEKPFDAFRRFVTNDGIFDAATGLSEKEIREKILADDRARASLPHSLRKAYALATVLENTRINCDPRDYFPALHAIDRPLGDTLIARWRREVFTERIPSVNAEMRLLGETGAVTIWPDFDHNLPVWDIVFQNGFAGLLKRTEAARAAFCREHGTPTESEQAFFESILITYRAILHLIRRLRIHAEGERAKNEKTALLVRGLHRLESGAPESFYDVLLTIYLYFMVSEHIEGLQVRSLCNFDRQLYPYFKRDLEAGVPESELRRQIAYFFYQFSAIGNYWGQPVYFGGTMEDGTTAVNRLSYVALEVYDEMGLLNPKIQIKYSSEMPKDFLLRTLDMIRRGHNSIVFVSEKTMIRTLLAMGATEEEARRADITGCYEYKLSASAGTGMNYLNLLKPLEYVLFDGRDGRTGQRITAPTGELPTFDAFYGAYKSRLANLVLRTVATVNAFEGYLAEINPQIMLSASFDSCLARGRDPYAGGSVHTSTSIMLGGLASITDALTAVRRFVYESGELTLDELRAILRANWEGHEILRQRILSDPEKYGNNRPIPDSIARDITEFVYGLIKGVPNTPVRGGTWKVGTHVARQSYDQGRLTVATPDGRKEGDEYSKNSSPVLGMGRGGATAMILSLAAVDATHLSADCALDLGLLPSAVSGEDGLEAMYALLMAHERLGCHAIHINVFDADTLCAAQKNPEQYADLQIRVSGWNVLFRDISKKEQDGFIRQAEGLE